MDGVIFSERLEERWDAVKDKFELSEFLNRKIFRVSDSSLTYRQINNLEELGLFVSGRKSGKGWRNFNIKEMVYLEILRELRKYGLNSEQLNGLRETFFSNNAKKSREQSDLIVGACLAKVEVVLGVEPNGVCSVYDPSSFIFFITNPKSQILLVVNDFVNDIIVKQLGQKPFLIEYGVREALKDGIILSEQERNLINRIRNGNFDSVTVKMKDGSPNLAYFSSDKQEGADMDEVIKQLEESNFQDIRVIKRDGKIVSIKKQEVFKLSSAKRQDSAGGSA